MSKSVRIRFESTALHGLGYGLAVAAAVLLQLGVFVLWLASVWRFKTGVRTFVPMSIAYPELYYFAMTIALAGGALFAGLIVIAALRWLRGMQYTLTELLSLVVVASGCAYHCVNADALGGTSYSVLVLYPIYKMIFPPAAPIFLWNGSPDFNTTVNALQLSILIALLVGLWGRIPSRLRLVKFGALGAWLAVWLSCKSVAMLSVAPALALPVLLFCGLSNRKPFGEVRQIVETFTQPVFPRRSKLPRRDAPLVQNP